MSTTNFSLLSLDPGHISCIGGRTVLTCRNCAGNAPRGSICTSCDGRGFNIFVCAHCNPAGAAASIRASSAALTATPGSSAPSSPASLSRSPSTSFPDSRFPRSVRRNGDGRDAGGNGSGCGRVEANTPRNL